MGTTHTKGAQLFVHSSHRMRRKTQGGMLSKQRKICTEEGKIDTTISYLFMTKEERRREREYRLLRTRLACIQHLGKSGLLVLCDGQVVLGLDGYPHAGVGAVVGLWGWG